MRGSCCGVAVLYHDRVLSFAQLEIARMIQTLPSDLQDKKLRRVSCIEWHQVVLASSKELDDQEVPALFTATVIHGHRIVSVQLVSLRCHAAECDVTVP